jgi:hypothetical protein
MEDRTPNAHMVEMEPPSSRAKLEIILIPIDEGKPMRGVGSPGRRPNFFEMMWTWLVRHLRGRTGQTPGGTKGRSS